MNKIGKLSYAENMLIFCYNLGEIVLNSLFFF
jgi:hypothetical protein